LAKFLRTNEPLPDILFSIIFYRSTCHMRRGLDYFIVCRLEWTHCSVGIEVRIDFLLLLLNIDTRVFIFLLHRIFIDLGCHDNLRRMIYFPAIFHCVHVLNGRIVALK
jgi:hypothetical protein